MIKSRCHKASVYVYSGNEGTSFYVCSHCDQACDTMSHGHYHGDGYDTGRQGEVEGIINTA